MSAAAIPRWDQPHCAYVVKRTLNGAVHYVQTMFPLGVPVRTYRDGLPEVHARCGIENCWSCADVEKSQAKRKARGK